jgi:hypothetical protein
MADVRFELDSNGVKALLRSEPVRAEIERRANAIAEAAGPGFEASVRVGANRVHGSVYATTVEAMLAEANEQALTRAIDAGR